MESVSSSFFFSALYRARSVMSGIKKWLTRGPLLLFCNRPYYVYPVQPRPAAKQKKGERGEKDGEKAEKGRGSNDLDRRIVTTFFLPSCFSTATRDKLASLTSSLSACPF